MRTPWRNIIKKQFSLTLPKLKFGFPIEEPATIDGAEPSPPKPPQRGVALLIAVMVIAVMMILTSDLILSSQVDLHVAAAERDNLKAEYMAKSAFNMGLFLVTADLGVKSYMAAQMKTPQVDSIGDMWSVLNGMPIGGDTAALIESAQKSFGLSKVMDSSVFDQLKLFDGQFTLDVSDESSRIDVNYCNRGRCSEVLAMLQALFSCPAEKAFLDNKKIVGKELAYKIKDYIDEDTKAEPESGVSDENDPYVNRNPPYKVKNAQLDTPGEMRMIDGWDDEVQAVFGKYITVYPFQATGDQKPHININTAPRALLGCMFPEAKTQCGDKFAELMKDRSDNKSALASSPDELRQVLQNAMCYTPGSGDSDTRASWFDTKSNIYRIVAKGQVGDQEKTLTAIVERMVPDGQTTKLSYRILYWRML